MKQRRPVRDPELVWFDGSPLLANDVFLTLGLSTTHCVPFVTVVVLYKKRCSTPVMSFLWSPAKTNDSAAAESNKKEFDDLLASKDLELQAILDGGAPASPPAEQASNEAAIPAAVSNTRRAQRTSAPAAGTSAAPIAGDAKLDLSPKLIFGIPRNLVIVVSMIAFAGAMVIKYMDGMWGATDLNEKTITEGDLAPK